MKRVLITGGNGYVGKYLSQYLLDLGYDVTITTRKMQGDKQDIKAREMDLLDTSSIKDVCKDMDIVIHTATMDERKIAGNEITALQINAVATRALYLDAVKNKAEKFIYFSTFHAYGKSFGNIDENTNPEPVSDYGLTHYIGELYLQQLAKKSNTKAVSVRLTNGIAPPLENVDKWYLVLNDFCRTVYETGEIVIKSNGLPIRDFVAITDVTKAISVLIEHATEDKKLDIYNISSESAVSIRDALELVSEIYEKRYKAKAKLKMKVPTQEEINSVQSLFVSSQKLRTLGWKPKKTISDVISEIFDCLDNSQEVKRCNQ